MLVCDLYAGIGSLGLEALSRGAERVTFVENDPQVTAVLRRNIAKTGVEQRTLVAAMDVSSFLASPIQPFDVVLADPPYHTVTWNDLRSVVPEVLLPGGFFVMEMDLRAQLPEDVDTRIIGKTKVAMWQRHE